MLILVLAAAMTPSEPAAPVIARRPSQPVLKIGAFALETLQSAGGPSRRSQAVVRGADSLWRASLVEEAPAMTSPLVRLLPEGGMRVRWRLLANAKWADGRPITAVDLEFSNRILANPLRTAIEKVDARTVDVTYSARRREFLESLALVPRASMEPVFADGGRDAVMRASTEAGVPTAAPYALKSFEANRALVLERNPWFPGPAPIFERIEVLKVDPATAAEALVTREVDVLPVLDARAYEALLPNQRVRVLEQPGDLLYVLAPNLDQPPWDALPARRALLAAIDRPALAALFQPAPAQAANSWRAGFALAQVPAYAPEAAAAALAGLGLKGHHLKLNVGKVRVKDSAMVKVTERVVADLTRAGLEVEVVEHDQLGPLFNRRDHQGLILVARDTNDPTRYLNVPNRGGHFEVEAVHGAHFDPPMLAAWERFAGSLYDERRFVLEQALQQLWVERLPMLPLVLTSRLAAVRADLIGPDWGQADSLYWNVGDWHLAEPKPPAP